MSIGLASVAIPHRRHRHHEDDAARALMTWVRIHEHRHPELRLLFAIPNGGWRDKREAARLKSMGVRAGVSDYMLPVPRYQVTRGMIGGMVYTAMNNQRSCGLWLELKSEDGRLSGPQAEWLRLMDEQGYAAKVCYGWVDAARAIAEYLGIEGIAP